MCSQPTPPSWHGLRRPRPGNRRAVTRPWGLYPCVDGFVSFLVLQPAHWRAMPEWIAEATGIDGVLDDVFMDRNDPHLGGAGSWRDEEHPVLGTLSMPGAPFRVDHDWWHWAAAPTLDQHAAAVPG